MRQIGLLLGAALVVGVACKSTPSGNGSDCSSTAANVVIDVDNGTSYSLRSATINRGQRVCWQNFAATSHTVTADFSSADTTWKLDAQLNPGFVILYNFNDTIPVDYYYHCRYHQAQGMTGVIHMR